MIQKTRVRRIYTTKAATTNPSKLPKLTCALPRAPLVDVPAGAEAVARAVRVTETEVEEGRGPDAELGLLWAIQLELALF